VSHNIVELVRELRPADAARIDELFPQWRRTELFQRIVSSRRPIAAARAPGRLAPSRPPRLRAWTWASVIRRARRPALISTLAAAAVGVAAAALLITSSAVRTQSAAGAVAFRAGGDGDIVATVTEPFAAESKLQAAFAKHGLHITVNLVPVSPSLVGTVVYTSDNGGASAIQPLQGGHCITGGGGCPIGLKIPATFTGNGYITLGRPARPGETYESQSSAFAPGETLHCTELLGARVATALPVLRADKLTAAWREDTTTTASDGTSTSSSKIGASPPAQNYIWEAVMTAPGKVIIWTQPTRSPANAPPRAGFNQGC
jgi:hypothetical protein